MKKIYWAITSPAPTEMEGEIKAHLIKGTTGPDKDKMIVDMKEGQKAYTNYEVMEVAGLLLDLPFIWKHLGTVIALLLMVTVFKTLLNVLKSLYIIPTRWWLGAWS